MYRENIIAALIVLVLAFSIYLFTMLLDKYENYKSEQFFAEAKRCRDLDAKHFITPDVGAYWECIRDADKSCKENPSTRNYEYWADQLRTRRGHLRYLTNEQLHVAGVELKRRRMAGEPAFF